MKQYKINPGDELIFVAEKEGNLLITEGGKVVIIYISLDKESIKDISDHLRELASSYERIEEVSPEQKRQI